MKKSRFLKVIAIILSCLLIYQQTGFAQVASVELNIAGRFASLQNTFSPDKFRPLHLRSISYDGLHNNFKLLLDKGDVGNLKPQDLESTTKDLLNYFFVGVVLPNDTFRVNLRPDSPDDVIDPLLAQTEVGKILLEADLQLKKDTANATNPQTSEGREYWNLLYQKAGEIYGNQNVAIPTLTRPWIVPDEIIIRESTDSAYVYKATLKVMLEQDYLKDNAAYSFKDERERKLNEYSAQIIRENIIPKLTKEINNAKRYAPLRQVYYSLILAQWFKARNQNKSNQYAGRINRKDLTNLQAKIPYSVSTYFDAYRENFAKGEYNIKEPVSTPYGQVVRSYFSGGMILVPDDTLLAQELVKPMGAAGNKTVLPGTPVESDSKHGINIQVDGDAVSVIGQGVEEDVSSAGKIDAGDNAPITTKTFSGSFNNFHRIIKKQVSANATIKFLPYLWDESQEFTQKEFLEYLTKYKNSTNIYFPKGTMMFLKVIELADGTKRYFVLASETHITSKPTSPNGKIIGYHKCSLQAAQDIARNGFYALPERWTFDRELKFDVSEMEFMKWEIVLAFTLNASDLKALKTPDSKITQLMFDLNVNKNNARLSDELRKKLAANPKNKPILEGDESGFLIHLNPEAIDIDETLRANEAGVKEGSVTPAALEKLKDYLESIKAENKQIVTGAVNYFDSDQNRAMEFLRNDSQAWVSFADMLKLSLRNNSFGRKIGDVFIEDAIRIAKKVLNENGGIGFRLGDRSDEFAIVLPGSLKAEEVENILLNIQKEIKDEYSKYAIARLPYGVVEELKNIAGVREAVRASRFSQKEGPEDSSIVFFTKDSGDANGRLTLGRILRESHLSLGEVEGVPVPYLPAGAVRFKGEGDLQAKLEVSLKEAEIVQRVAKQSRALAGIEGLIEKPAVKEGASLNGIDFLRLENYIEKTKEYLPGLREFVGKRYGAEKAKLVQLDNGLAAFMRLDLYEILEYVMGLAKSTDSFIFLVRGPPDSFYFISCGKGKWQITLVRQNILTVEGSSLENNFLSIIEGSGRRMREPGKYPFKVINDFDELGHNFGNQIIKLENISLLDAFNNQLAGSKEKDGVLDEQSINAALSSASRNMNKLIEENGFDFSVSFEAISVTSDDFAGQKGQSDAGIAAATLNIIEELNNSHKFVKISDDTVKFYSEYKNQWSKIEAEKKYNEAEMAFNADTELKKADLFYAGSIQALDSLGVMDVFDQQDLSGEEINSGGIDFRFLPIVIQSADNLKASIKFMPRPTLQRINLAKEWSDIERLINSGITPSAERLKEYFAASYVDGSLDGDMNKITSCISDILRMEEQDCSLTDPILKDILVVLGSGRNTAELKLVFAN
ncbi:MAG: diguanylate cyclase [Candidatus Omnitrophica bacterium]|nr:diguanylate cyclase [Candidatus Omnitrophota bacterium]